MRALVVERLAARGPERTIPASLAAETGAPGKPANDPANELANDSAAGPPRDAAVLVPLVERPAGMTVLLTRRAEHLDSHPGQIAFPGGRVDPGDSGPADTALRETEEEIGLPRARIEVIGRLDTCLTGTGFRVVPVVGIVAAPFALAELALDSAEVADAFEVPLAFLLNPANHVRRTAVARGLRRAFYVMPYGERYIWGATARMLVNLHEILRPAA